MRIHTNLQTHPLLQVKFRLGHLALFGLALVSPAHSADWMINEDYLQTDARGATAFEFLLAGDVAGRITGGGLTSVTNAFANPTRSSSLQPGFNNTIVRFAGSDTIAPSATGQRHFGIFGTGVKPTVLTKAWSFPTAPTRVPVPKSNFSFTYDALNEALRITLENTSPDTVTFRNVGYAVNSNETPIEQLTATGLPLSAFIPLQAFDHEYLPGDFFSVLINNVPAQSYALSYASVLFSGASSAQDYRSLGGEWAQVRVAAATAVAEPTTLWLSLAALLLMTARNQAVWLRARARRCGLGLVLGAAACGAALADVWVVPLAAPPTPGDVRPFIDLKAKDTTGADIVIKTLIDGGASSSELKVTVALGGQLGVSGGVAGVEVGINGRSPSTTGASIPAAAAVGFSSAPVSPPGQAAAAPPLPATAATGTLPPGRQATLGSGYLEANFDAHGRLDGQYWFVAKGQGATGGVATANAIASFLAFSAAVATNPDGRPLGTKSEEVTPLRRALPGGEMAEEGGYLLGLEVRSGAFATSNALFLLKSGYAQTLLSTQLALALGIDIATLPTSQLQTNLGNMLVGLADVELDLFGDATFPGISTVAAIAINPADNAFGLNLLGSDVLGALPYWDIDTTNPAAPRFSAAAMLSFVPEPGTLALIAGPLGLLLCPRWVRRSQPLIQAPRLQRRAGAL